ncbi:kinesin light chain [Klebsormidium nitens]|uniref:Kinesin light chain n=1 Tax=Klebsormidium nitens TaxID=105231 RepID=A0A1Y1ICY0_KLENI|nr:kinesin light chain [Klebsormidium nitens]|eukprot:GAQ87802.1 kinesin light chain [Klebsormidium nitens]
MGALVCKKGRDEEAVPLFKRALGIREKALGPAHPDTNTLRSDLEDAERKVAQMALRTDQGMGSSVGEDTAESRSSGAQGTVK